MRAALVLAVGLGLSSGACAPEIGDECQTSIDCDVQNRRLCDRTQPGGYCTLAGCEQGSCPDGALCVRFRPEPARLSATWCMASCGDGDDCRSGYTCTTAGELNERSRTSGGLRIAEIVGDDDDGDRRFCAAATEANESEDEQPDAGAGE